MVTEGYGPAQIASNNWKRDTMSNRDSRWRAARATAIAVLATTPQAALVSPAHVSFGDDPKTQVTVTWRTTTQDSSVVRYGVNTAYSSRATGESVLSESGDGYQNIVRLSGLTPGTLYHYSASTVVRRDVLTAPVTQTRVARATPAAERSSTGRSFDLTGRRLVRGACHSTGIYLNAAGRDHVSQPMLHPDR